MTVRVSRSWLMQGARLALPLLLFILTFTEPAQAQTPDNQAGLVIVYGGGRVTTRCVAFSESQITGADLIVRSGLPVVSTAGPLGVTICALNGEGCPSTDCFCECHSTPCIYWLYYYGNPDGSWTYANIGAVSRQITDGAVDAWVWGDASQLPPSLAFDTICKPSEPAVVPPVDQQAPVSTSTLSPPPTLPPVPTETVVAEVAATPMASRTPDAAVMAVEDTPTPAPTVTASFTSTPEAATAVSEVPIVTGTPVMPSDPTQLDVPTPSDGLMQGVPGQIVAFVAVLSIVGGTFALLSRRSGAK